jgi:hypothetical protein
MQRLSSNRSKPYAVGAFGLSFALLAFGCSPTTNNPPPASGGSNSGGANSSGGNLAQGGSNASGGRASSGGSSNAGGGSSAGGSNAGGSNAGGSNAGGSNVGGSNAGGSNVGGSNAGGSNVGGSNAGDSNAGGSNVGGSNVGGSNAGGSNAGGSNVGGSNVGGSNAGGSSSGGSKPGGTTATGGTGTGGSTGTGGCVNTNTSVINVDSSGYICNNKWGIQGAWYCYSSDTSSPCNPTGVIPWNTAKSAMCLSGTIAAGGYAGLGLKVNSGPPGSTGFKSWNASSLVGFAITFVPGPSGTGSNGMILNVEYPTTADLTPGGDAPGITVPGVGSSEVTYNALFSDAVVANYKAGRIPVDLANLTDVKISFLPDSVSHTYDFCIKSVVPLTTAPSPVVATGAYGPTWSNLLPQAVNSINGYAVQSAPFPLTGNPMTMQVSATSGGVGFTYTPGGSFQAPNNGPGSFPAIISGWGPGHDGDQFYGPYQGGKQIGQLTSIKSNWSFTMGSSGDAAYDVWFSNSSAQPTNVSNGALIELMIWIGNTGKNPLGSSTSSSVTGSDGVARTAWTGGTNGTGDQVVSYLPSASSTSVTNFDVLKYFQDAASHGYAGLKPTSYLLGIQAGFEVYGGNWSTTDYNISIQ